MANYNGDEKCLSSYGDQYTDGPLYSPAITTSTVSLTFSIPSNVWVVKGNRVYVTTTNETATASATNYYWIDIFGVVRATTTNTAPTSSSVLEYTIVTNSSGVTSSTLPAITTPTFTTALYLIRSSLVPACCLRFKRLAHRINFKIMQEPY